MDTATYIDPNALHTRSADGRHYIEGICVPYQRITHSAGPVPEQFEPGAFSDLLASRARVKLTDYNHSRERVPVGYSEAFEERPTGLWARFRLNRTPEGDSAHANAVEGVYRGLSVGFVARQHEIRSGVRHVLKARLDHVSLVETPAYAEAEILAVRGARFDPEPYRRLLTPPRYTPTPSMPEGGLVAAVARLRHD
ncbi:HK97 family phage prohead protease [Microbacterium sp. NPDC056234]|uniref:HK97 family phage prohead protease n=1 Tax=Microbacterium sp. NPDC056234 TaxID=3345757 RepID=UPI0035D8874A